jgi:DNA-binding transcriptional regulator YdaS (Cro superfamily)
VKNNKPYQALLETDQGRALYELIEAMPGIHRITERLGVESYILNNWVHIWKQCSPEGAALIGEKIGGRFSKTSQGRALIAIIQKAGGRSGFAAIMGVAPNIVDCWVQRGAAPISRAAEIADKMGMDVASVRPDKFEGICP